ncbi:hypothetical protein NAT51_14145 [Flavobacterium amniphilum]|uniref:hypothetical protein n=1 Tax=Flavobacterium amniphilum TaxID=1834035 RepID=UPI00202AB0A5|nr:hypothetical protein [Flavobacterium amniphilum]MCL9806673.1 hypothetical protein [Flavobacterium amniphilum]
MIQRTILPFVLILLLTGCGKSNDAPEFVEKERADSIFSEAKDDGRNTKKDTTAIPNFPTEEDMSLELLLAGGVFHDDEVKEGSDTKSWMGIFETKNGFLLAETKITMAHAHDAILDETEDDKTGWEIDTTLKDTCLYLIEKIPSLTERKIKTVKVPETILPKKKFKFTFSGNQYTLSAEGTMKKQDEESDYEVLTDYRLYLTANINGKDHTALLVAQDIFDDQMIKILFAGDIDGDGKLDLIIDTSYHYNMGRPTLYLSKPADDNQIIKPVGMFTFVGC